MDGTGYDRVPWRAAVFAVLHFRGFHVQLTLSGNH